MAERVGFVGLGRMGTPMARRLAAAGVSLAVFDSNPDATSRVAPVTIAASLAALAQQSDVVITMLPNGAAVRDVVAGGAESGDRLLDGLARGAVLIDMGSSAPIGTRTLGNLLSERGVAMLDAPVSGGVVRAENGTLAVMVGGEPAALERCRPLLAIIGRDIFATGPLGSGHALKALNNLVSAAGLLAAAEALVIGRRFGLDASVMIDVFNASSGRNNSTESKFKQFVLSRTFASGFALDLMVKDLGTAVDLALATETPATFSTACRDLWKAAQAALGEGADHTAIVRWLESLAQTRL